VQQPNPENDSGLFYTLEEMTRDYFACPVTSSDAPPITSINLSSNVSTDSSSTSSTSSTTSTTSTTSLNPLVPNVSRAKEAAKNKRRRKFFVCEPDHVVTDAEWNQMQYHLDRCFCAWVIRHGPTAVYNYMHFFGADHILYYGKRWKNLAILNQQVSYR